MKSLHLSSSRASAGRRDFLAWLLAAPTLAGCAVEATTGGESPALDEVDPGEAATTESELGSCRITTRDAEGPYFSPGAPQRTTLIAGLTEPGVRLVVEGRLYGPDCKTPLRGYTVDVWQASAAGVYYDGARDAYRLRGKIVSDNQGRYRFETILPGRYGDAAGIRPAHIHAKILTPGGNPLLTTQLYFAGDPYLGSADYCTRQGTCNSADAKRALKLLNATVSGKAGKRATFDAFLPRT